MLENLALACAPCNGAKREKINATDPRTGKVVRFFHPRIDDWEEHFRWDATHSHNRSYRHRKNNSSGSAL